MLKMTEQQFREWVSSTAFSFSASLEAEMETEKQVDHDEEGQPILAPSVYACAWRAAAAELPDGTPFEATYQECVEWMGDLKGRFVDEHETYANESAPGVLISGVMLIDEEGDSLDDPERLILEVIEGLDCIDYSALLPKVVTEDIDIDEDADMEVITLENDNAPAVRFSGELVAETSSSANNASSYYSGSTGRWTTLKLYKTKSGKLVCQSIGHTQWQGEHDRYKVAVCDTSAEVIAFFGHGWLAKALYEDAGIADVTEVD